MNKKLLAVAVAGALAAPGLALAQAANVQIYGLLDVRLDSMKFTGNTAGTTGAQTKWHMSGGQPNYIGFRGSEDLGGGLTAFFQVETQLFPDARQDVAAQQHTNATLGGRPTFLGLRSTTWGEVYGGYVDTIYKDVQRATWSVAGGTTHAGIIMGNGNTSGSNPSAACTAAFASGSNNLLAGAATTNCTEAPGSTTSFNRTISDAVTYRSPTFSGFRAAVQMTMNEFKEPSTAAFPVAGTGSQNSALRGYSLTWSGGPFSAAAAYEEHRGFRAGSGLVGTQVRDAKDSGFTLGGQWNYGMGKIGLGYERIKYAASSTVAAVATDGFTLPAWALQGTYNLTGADTLYMAYSKTPGRKSCGTALAAAVATPVAGAPCGGDTGSKMLSFGITHDLSKRTALYAYYSKIDNNASATYNYPSDSRTTNQLGISGSMGSSAGLSAGTDSTSYNVGVKHTF